jgi:hypothetical protein
MMDNTDVKAGIAEAAELTAEAHASGVRQGYAPSKFDPRVYGQNRFTKYVCAKVCNMFCDPQARQPLQCAKVVRGYKREPCAIPAIDAGLRAGVLDLHDITPEYLLGRNDGSIEPPASAEEVARINRLTEPSIASAGTVKAKHKRQASKASRKANRESRGKPSGKKTIRPKRTK